MMPVYCPLCCDQPFEDQQMLFFHLRGLRNNLFCPICSERFTSLEFLIKHLSRKCYGPLSPTDAKRKCLSNSTISDELDQSSLAITPDIQATQITVTDGAQRLTEDETVTQVDSHSPVKAAASLIPPELKRKLSKNVTLSVRPTEKTTESSTSSSETSQSASLTKTLLNSSLDTQTSVEGKKTEVMPPTPLEISAVDSILALSKKQFNSSSDTKNSDLSNQTELILPDLLEEPEVEDSTLASKRNYFAKPGPLSSKFGKRSHSEISAAKRKTVVAASGPAVTKNINGPVDPTKNKSKKYHSENPTLSTPSGPVAEKEKSRKKVVKPNSPEVTNQVISPVTTAADSNTDEVQSPVKRRSRGRPRKYHSNPPTSDPPKESSPSMVNGHSKETPRLDAVEFVAVHEPMQVNGEKEGEEEVKKEMEISDQAEQETKYTGGVEPNTEEEDEYTCSACNVRFTSIYEHIKQFHNGEEVVVEVPEEEIKEDLKAYQSDNDTKTAKKPLTTESDKTDNECELNLKKSSEGKKSNSSTRSKPKKETLNNSSNKSKNISNLCSEVAPSKHVKKQNNILTGKWFQSKNNKDYYQFVSDYSKFNKLVSEIKNNKSIHPEFEAPVNQLFENPKINVIEITKKPNSPFFTHREVDFKIPIPMYVMERQPSEADDSLGGIASYVIANPAGLNRPTVAKHSRVIAVMKVILSSDKTLTVENIVFKNKPANENMVPVLEDVLQPDIPLLKDAKILKWQCIKCLATTWRFPLSKDSHECHACNTCHKPFLSSLSLNKHMITHTKEAGKYCATCDAAFASKKSFDKHMELHKDNALCPLCKRFVPNDEALAHQQLHAKEPHEQFTCSVCNKMFGSSAELKGHQDKMCARLVPKFNCSWCSRNFFTLGALSSHIKKHKSSISKGFPCKGCSKTFLNEKEQIWHQRIHTRARPFRCAACPKRFHSFLTQQSHIAQAHHATTRRDVPVHMCPVCDKVFSNATMLSTHLKCHTVT